MPCCDLFVQVSLESMHLLAFADGIIAGDNLEWRLPVKHNMENLPECMHMRMQFKAYWENHTSELLRIQGCYPSYSSTVLKPAVAQMKWTHLQSCKQPTYIHS